MVFCWTECWRYWWWKIKVICDNDDDDDDGDANSRSDDIVLQQRIKYFMGKFYLSMNLQSIGIGRKELQGNGLQENTRSDFHFMLVWTKDRIIWLSYCIAGEVVGLMWSGLEDKTANRWSDRSRRERGRVDWILPMWCWAVISLANLFPFSNVRKDIFAEVENEIMAKFTRDFWVCSS